MVLFSFISLLLFYILSGVFSNYSPTVQTNKEKLANYFIAGSKTKPFFVALATFSTNTSAFMFTGFIGFTYFYGFSAFWLIFGWVVGDLLSSLLFYKKIVQFAKQKMILSFPSLVVGLIGKNYQHLRLVISLISLVFISFYAIAQIMGGGKVLANLFNVSEEWGSFLTIFILSLYCIYGGLKASIVVNTMQSIVMIFGATILLSILIYDIGGIMAFIETIKTFNPSFTSLTPSYLSSKSNIIFFITGWIFAGIGTVGMPHTTMQVTTLDKLQNINKMRFYYYFIYLLFCVLTFLTGIGIKIYMPSLSFAEAENSLIKTSGILLNPIFHGFILASIFASIMSSVDSQTIACTSIISQDVMKKEDLKISYVRLLIIGILAIFFVFSLFQDTIFFLYSVAWAVMASSFSPLMFLIIFKRNISEKMAIFLVLFGAITSIAWYSYNLNAIIHESFIGITASLLAYFILNFANSYRPKST